MYAVLRYVEGQKQFAIIPQPKENSLVEKKPEAEQVTASKRARSCAS